MNTKRKLVFVAITTLITACGAPQPKQGAMSAASQAAPEAATSATESVDQPKTNDGDAVIIIPLDQSTPASEAPAMVTEPAAPEMAPVAAPKAQEEMSAPVPVVEAAPAAPPAATPKPAPSAPAKAAVPQKAATVVADKISREFTVNVGPKDASHPYFGRGHDMGFSVDGVEGRELVLTRGVEYTFHVDTDIKHDFYFTTSPVGRGAGTVTDGISGQFTYRGDVTFTPTASTPEVMYYECRNHKYMGGKIHIANAGDKVAIGGGTTVAPEDTNVPSAVSEAQVKQKLSYAEMLLNSSPSAKRVAASSNTEAKRQLEQARQQIAGAKSALAGGNAAAGMDAVNEALRLVASAGQLVPSDVAHADLKPRYTELLDQLHGFEKSYQKNLSKGMKPKSGKELDKVKFNGLVKDAEAYASKEQYGDAVKSLEGANEMLTAALTALLDSQTMVYEQNFATPQEEYEFELARYGSYEELIPIAIEQRKPSEQTVAMMDELTTKAKEIRAEGEGLAAKGDHKMAIMALQAATERLQRALRLAGVQ